MLNHNIHNKRHNYNGRDYKITPTRPRHSGSCLFGKKYLSFEFEPALDHSIPDATRSSTSRAASWGFRAGTPSCEVIRRKCASAALGTHNVRLRTPEATQLLRWRTEPSQDLSPILVYSPLFRFPQCGAWGRFIGRVDLTVWET